MLPIRTRGSMLPPSHAPRRCRCRYELVSTYSVAPIYEVSSGISGMPALKQVRGTLAAVPSRVAAAGASVDVALEHQLSLTIISIAPALPLAALPQDRIFVDVTGCPGFSINLPGFSLAVNLG